MPGESIQEATERAKEAKRNVTLDPDIAWAFPSAKAVNKVLRKLLEEEKAAAG